MNTKTPSAFSHTTAGAGRRAGESFSAHGRRTNDYSPTKVGSREYNAAVNARREMLNLFATRGTK